MVVFLACLAGIHAAPQLLAAHSPYLTHAPVAYASHAPVAYAAHAPVAYAHAPVAVAHAPVAARVESYDPHPQYSFEYSVNDAHTGDQKAQHESRWVENNQQPK